MVQEITKREISIINSESSLNIHRALGSTIVAESFPLYRVTTNSTPTSGTMRAVTLWLPTAQIITGVKWVQITQGAYTASNYNGIGLYTYSGGTLTQVAVTTNDGDIWKAAPGMQSKAFTTPYAAQFGLYFVLMLYSTSAQTTAPVMGAATSTVSVGVATGDYTNSARFIGLRASQTALPSPTMAITNLASMQVGNYFALYI